MFVSVPDSPLRTLQRRLRVAIRELPSGWMIVLLSAASWGIIGLSLIGASSLAERLMLG